MEQRSTVSCRLLQRDRPLVRVAEAWLFVCKTYREGDAPGALRTIPYCTTENFTLGTLSHIMLHFGPPSLGVPVGGGGGHYFPGPNSPIHFFLKTHHAHLCQVNPATHQKPPDIGRNRLKRFFVVFSLGIDRAGQTQGEPRWGRGSSGSTHPPTLKAHPISQGR